MPTPVGHTLAGITIALAAQRPRFLKPVAFGAAVIAVASFPDLDFIPGYLMGDAGRFHWGPTHSFFAALLAGAIIGVLCWKWRGQFWRPAIITTITWLSHVVLDMLLGPVRGAPFGLEAFWPFSHQRVMLPWSVFILYPNDAIRENPFTALLHPQVAPLIGRELLVLGPIALALALFRFTRARATLPSSPPRTEAAPPGTAAGG